jgi:DNA modification methylase
MSVQVLVGDCREVLPGMEAGSVHCCVTSPPYYGLRDYGVEGQIGLEPTLAEYIATLVGVFREVRRVLRDDGTIWLNIGDSYCSHDPGDRRDGEFLNPGGRQSEASRGARNKAGTFARGQFGLKRKDLMMVPARVAIALQDDGWYLRSDIIWSKPNPMPESVADRPTSAHEHVFLLSKSPRYHFDAASVRTPAKWAGPNSPQSIKSPFGQGFTRKADKQRGHSRRHDGFNDRWDALTREEQMAKGANIRNVWTVATQPFPGAHFATFPPKLVEPMILAGCPEGGTVLDPFGGSGTTGLVADRLGRNAVLIELNSEYAEMGRERVRNDAPLFADVR